MRGEKPKDPTGELVCRRHRHPSGVTAGVLRRSYDGSVSAPTPAGWKVPFCAGRGVRPQDVRWLHIGCTPIYRPHKMGIKLRKQVVRGTGIESVTVALTGEGTSPNLLSGHPCCGLDTGRSGHQQEYARADWRSVPHTAWRRLSGRRAAVSQRYFGLQRSDLCSIKAVGAQR
jgi:hypothetical protein